MDRLIVERKLDSLQRCLERIPGQSRDALKERMLHR